jgi:hypothetical protein
MPINFFSFPSEIQNKIYEELLVLSEPIILEMATDPLRDICGVLQATNNWLTSELLRRQPLQA